MTISLAQITEIRSELDAAVVALSNLSGAIRGISGRLAVLSADDVDGPPSSPQRTDFGGMGWTLSDVE